jgi:hypothetical protein
MREAGPTYRIALTCHKFEPWRIERLAKTLGRALLEAQVRKLDDVLCGTLISLHDHKGILTAEWGPEVFETDNAVDPDLPVTFLIIEDAWSQENECNVVHRVGATVIEREWADEP